MLFLTPFDLFHRAFSTNRLINRFWFLLPLTGIAEELLISPRGGQDLPEEPRYWDSWKGQILRAIIIDNAVTWADVRNRSGLEQGKMYKVVGDLQRAGVLLYSKDEGFRILNEELYRSYENATDQKVPESKEPSREHIDWLTSWIDKNEECDATLDHHHFFLDGPSLYEITRKLIGQARKSISVVNPYVDKAGLGTALRNAAKNGIEVLLIRVGEFVPIPSR